MWVGGDDCKGKADGWKGARVRVLEKAVQKFDEERTSEELLARMPCWTKVLVKKGGRRTEEGGRRSRPRVPDGLSTLPATAD